MRLCLWLQFKVPRRAEPDGSVFHNEVSSFFLRSRLGTMAAEAPDWDCTEHLRLRKGPGQSKGSSGKREEINGVALTNFSFRTSVGDTAPHPSSP